MSITAIAIGAALKTLFDRLAKVAGEQGHAQLQKRFVTKTLQSRIAKKIASLDKVRTVFSKQAKLSEFYVPARFEAEARPRFAIDALDEVESANLVLGIAGQGKSIFLRHLAIREANEGRYIPIFAELKRLGEGTERETLWSFLQRTLERFDIPHESEALNVLLRSGVALVLLDAFDELPFSQRDRVAREIEDLVIKFPEAKIFVSSRPDTEITHSPHLNQMAVSELSQEHRNLLIKRIYGEANSTEAIALQKALQKSASIAGVLKTPLIVALLTVTFNRDVFLPETLPKFYEQVFEAMLVQHDSAKLLIRPRKSKLSDAESRQAFEAYCAISLQNNNLRFSKSRLLKNIGLALTDQKISHCTSENVFSDIVEITCLVIRDGDAYEFIHKTIMEYFASSFIAHLPEPRAKSFYEEVLGKQMGWEWSEAIPFLSELDQYRFSKYFLVPTLNLFLSAGPFEELVSDRNITFEELEEVFGDMFILMNSQKSNGGITGYTFESERHHIKWSPAINHVLSQPLFDAVISVPFSGGDFTDRIEDVLSKKGTTPEEHFEDELVTKISLGDVFEDPIIRNEFLESVTQEIKLLLKKRAVATEILEHQENQGGFLF